MDGSVASALAALEAARAAVNALDLTSSMDALEADSRRAPVLRHRIVNRLSAEANPLDLGATSLSKLLAYRLRISGSEARQRIDAAADLGPRTAMTGEALTPVLGRTADARRGGRIGAEHITAIRQFFAILPGAVDAETRVEAERTLARIAERQGPEGLRQAANRLLAHLHPDGDFSDAQRARKRGVQLGPQRPDGMSRISGELTPEARVVYEALFAEFAAPGMCNPDDEEPIIDGEPADGVDARDSRSQAQRNHDALLAMGRMLLCSGNLGQLNGLPVTVIVSTTLRELETGAGHAVTGGGSLLPMRDVIRMAAHAYHYLAVFDDHTQQTLHLGRRRRLPLPGAPWQGRLEEQRTDGQTTLRSRADRTTAWSRPPAGPRCSARTVAPSGFHRRAWTPGRTGSTICITRSECCATPTGTSRDAIARRKPGTGQTSGAGRSRAPRPGSVHRGRARTAPPRRRRATRCPAAGPAG